MDRGKAKEINELVAKLAIHKAKEKGQRVRHICFALSPRSQKDEVIQLLKTT